MAENKKSVLLYCDIIHTVEELSDEEAGKLFKHYLRYINDLNPVEPDKLTKIVFEPIKQNLKRDLKTWKIKVKKRSEAGKKGMAVRYGKEDKIITNDNNVINPITNLTDTVTVKDNVTVTVKEINNTPPVIFSIEHCLTVALNDQRWVDANKATRQDLETFNKLLEKRGVYDKNPMDYKTHYANWKDGGRKDEAIDNRSKDEIAATELLDKMRKAKAANQ